MSSHTPSLEATSNAADTTHLAASLPGGRRRRHASEPRTGPRERALLHGLASLSEAELIAVLLGTGQPTLGATAIAAELLDDLGLEDLARVAPQHLASRAGIGPVKALRVSAAFELGRRASAQALIPRERVVASSDVAAHLRAKLSHLDHEEMWLLSLDGQNGVRSLRRVAQGGLHGCCVSARDILRLALREGASAFVLAHNHPSGDPRPSPEDVAMSRVLFEAGELVGVPLVDHVVVARAGHSSLLDLGLLP